MLVAHVTDTHILAAGKLYHSPHRAIPADAEPGWSYIDTGACLARAIAQLNVLPTLPDIIVVTGDLTDHGGAEDRVIRADGRGGG